MKRLNARRVKVHRSYTVEEAAKLFGAHKNTVRNWLKEGLPKVDDRRPILILGRQLASFVHARRQHRRQRCSAGELFCFKCRKPRRSLDGKAEYLPTTDDTGNLRAACSHCGTRMYRRVSLRRLAASVGDLRVALPQAQQRIVEGLEHCPGCASGSRSKSHVDWVRYLDTLQLFGLSDPLFPATVVVQDQYHLFQTGGLSRRHWSNATPIRTIFKEAFTSAGLAYANPHSFRKTLAQLGERLCRTPEEFKAWSQNLGHEQVLTTFSSYGQVGPHRQAELIRHLADRRETGSPKLEAIDRMIRILEEGRHALE